MSKTNKITLCVALVMSFFVMTFAVSAASLEFNTDGVYEITGNNTHVSNATVKDGYLTFTTSGTDPQLYIDKAYDVNTKQGGVVDADKVKTIEIKFASTAKTGVFQVYFWSVNPEDGSYYCNPYKDGDSSDKSYVSNKKNITYTGTGNIDDFITLTIDQSDVKYWKGMVGHLRIDTGSEKDVSFKIDYIKFIETAPVIEKPANILAEEKLYGECLFYDDFESYNDGDVPSSVYYSKLGTTALTKADQCKAIEVESGITGNSTNVIALTGSSDGEFKYPFIRVAYPLSEKGEYTMIADIYSENSGLHSWCFFNGYKKSDGTSSRFSFYDKVQCGEWKTVSITKNTAGTTDFAEFTYFGFGGEGVALNEKLYYDNIRVYFKKAMSATVSGGDGATGTAPSVTFYKNGTVTFPENTFTKNKYKFKGWTTNVDSKVYNPGDTMNVGDTVSLVITAVWEREVPAEKTPAILAEEKLYGECLFFDDFESYETGYVPTTVYYSNLGETELKKADQCGAIKITDGISDNETKVIELAGNGIDPAYPFIRVWYPLDIKGKYTMLADMYTEAGEVKNFCFFNGFSADTNSTNKRIMYYPEAVRNEWTPVITDYKTGDIVGFESMLYFGFGAEGVKKGEYLYIDNIRLYFEEAQYAEFIPGSGVTGNAPELEYYINDTIVLPYNTFEKEGYVFAGWKSSIDGKIYKECEKITVGNITDLTLTATWARFVPKIVRKNSIRDTADGVQGIRFAGYVADEDKHYASEIGFIATREDLLGDTELVFGDTKANGVGYTPDGVKVVYGATYDKASGKDLIYTKDGNLFGGSIWKDVEGTFFTGVITNIPESAYFDKFVVRPYALIDGEYVYGDTISRSVRDIAESAYNAGSRENYVMDIVEKTGIVLGRRVCFLGDSITHGGTFIKELAQLYLDSETEKGRYEFYNCGISGDTAGNAVRRLEDDVLAYNPDIVFIMFGMNDIGQPNYIKEEYNEEKEAKRQASLNYYRENMISIVETLIENDVEVILCTPTPYDDVTDKVYDCNAGLEKCAEIVRELAEIYDLELIDHYKNMYDLRGTKYWGVNDPIHPNYLGHHVMAQSIMYDLGYIDEMDVENAITEYDEINDERHTKSYNFRMFVMVERSMLREGLTTTEAKLQRAKVLQSQQTSDHFVWIYQNYIDNCGKGMEMLEEVIRLTEEMSYKN